MELTRLLPAEAVSNSLCVNVDNPQSVNPSPRSPYNISPTFSIADILASSCQKPPDHPVNSKGSYSACLYPAHDANSESSVCMGTMDDNVSDDVVKVEAEEEKDNSSPLSPNYSPQKCFDKNSTTPTEAYPRMTHQLSVSQKTVKLKRSDIVHVDVPEHVSEVSDSDPLLAKQPVYQHPCFRTSLPKKHPTDFPLNTSDLPRLTSTLEILLDAARCARAEAQVEKAESILNELMAKFAEPLDLYTAWNNLRAKGNLDTCHLTTESSDPNTSDDSLSPKPLYSPVFKLLLSQPASQIFPDLYQSSSSGHELQELCNRLKCAIRRAKGKLRILQRLRSKQSTAGSPQKSSGHTNASVSEVNEQRRRTFYEQLHSICPDYPPTGSVSCTSSSTMKSTNNFHPSTELRLTNCVDSPRPSVYTNPVKCPLSLLSFVSSLTDSNPTVETSPVNSVRTTRKTSTTSQLYEPCRDLTPSVNKDAVRSCSSQDLSSWTGTVKPQVASDAESPTSSKLSLPSPSVSVSSCSSGSCGRAPTSVSGRPGKRNFSSDRPQKSSIRPKRSRVRRGKDEQRAITEPVKKAVISCPIEDTEELIDLRSLSHSLKRSKKSEICISDSNEERIHPLSDNRLDVPLLTGKTIVGCNGKTSSESPKELNRVGTKWEQLSVLIRETDSNELEALHEKVQLPSPMDPLSTTTLSPHSPSTSDLSLLSPPSKVVGKLERDRLDDEVDDDAFIASSSSLHPELGETGTLSSSDELNWISNRPPTPDIRKIDLDLADLSDGTRVLVIQDTHLRAGTLYMGSSVTNPATRNISTSNLRDAVFRIHLDCDRSTLTNTKSAHLQGPQVCTPSGKTRLTNPRRASSPTPSVAQKKLRQNDVSLRGWQVVQQAVLEVFPASIRHLPPGTRVCASWSEQLAHILYPGTVVEPEEKERIQINYVPVDFDDGDHRQVCIQNIRMLPDHFTNLHELASSTGGQGVCDLMTEFIDLTSPTGSSDRRTSARIRRHSAVDSISQRSSERLLPGGRPSHFSLDMVTTNRLDIRATVSDTNNLLTIPHSQLETVASSSNSVKSTEDSGIDMKISPSLQPCSLVDRCDMSPSVDLCKSTENTEIQETFSHKSIPISLPPTPSCSHDCKQQCTDSNVTKDSVLAVAPDDDINLDSASSDAENSTWNVLEKCRRRKHGSTYCRSIIREGDGLVVSLGDSVEFSANNEEVYLGEVRDIRFDESAGVPVVIAAWYYRPAEMGTEGQPVSHISGALFATEHLDENEARCIIGRANVASNYKQFCELQQAQTLNPEKITGKLDNPNQSREDSRGKAANSSSPLSNGCDRGTTPNEVESSNESRQAPEVTRPKTATNGMGTKESKDPLEASETKTVVTSSSGDEGDDTIYFIAGKYDPVHHRITAWDPDLARVINLNK
ncbi:unnamed protein product [Calicophoron daubneyi]|uniref:BAH domain-containing protein n=1 Tax=Calicophoron daubneyi TaxID=300641 RepID=A0AAV2TBE3_CALDB